MPSPDAPREALTMRFLEEPARPQPIEPEEGP